MPYLKTFFISQLYFYDLEKKMKTIESKQKIVSFPRQRNLNKNPERVNGKS